MRNRKFSAVVSLFLAMTVLDAAFAQRPSEERIYRIERQNVTVEEFKAEGYILDIGGGGEGIIGLVKPAQTVAIDLMKDELANAPAGPLKIVMDATDLKFLDASFHTATSFFTLMFMKEEDQAKAVKEIYRVLTPGGRFLLWEVNIPERIDSKKDVFIVPLNIKLPKSEVQTGYGCLWPPNIHDVKYFIELAESAGFKVIAQKPTGRTFYLELQK
jgi:ubiquinone/menaquinone biosynthesis C-methylase UbiE